MRNFIQPGDSLAIAVPYAGGVLAGQGVLVGALCGVAATDGAQNAIIEAATPTVGQARDWPPLGCFQIGASPDGDVTCDLRGDAGEVYVETTAGVLRRLLQTLGPGFGATEFDADAWTLADADLPGPIGFYQGATPTTALAAAETVLAGCGAILAGDRTGRLRLSDPLARDPIPQFDIPAAWIVGCRPLPLPAAFQPPPRVVEVAWGPQLVTALQHGWQRAGRRPPAA